MSENLQTSTESKALTTGWSGFYAKNKKNVQIAGGALIVVVGGWLAYQFLYLGPRNKEANEALWRVEQWVEMDSMNWVLQGNGEFIGAEELMNKYSGTVAAEKAKYYTACAKRNNGDFQGALDLFKDVDFNDNTIGIQAIGNAGDMYVELGQFDDAADWLQKAAKKAMSSDSKDALAPFYLMKAARVQVERQDFASAKELLQEVVDNFKRSQEIGEAQKMLGWIEAQGK
jgi:tetratricopeptide (TPR) repeat protein